MTIGFIVAMDTELESSFKKKMNCYIHMSLNQKYYIFDNKKTNKSFVLTFSGIGKANAASVCLDMIKTFNIKNIINLGVVGSHKIDTKVKETILVDKFYYLDVDVTPFGYSLGQVPKENPFYNSSSFLNQKIIEIFNESDIQYHFKNIGTIDSFVDRNNYQKYYNKNFDAVDCIDMESTAIAQIANKNNVNFSSIKLVSDNLNNDEISSDQFNDILKKLAKKITNILFILIDKMNI